MNFEEKEGVIKYALEFEEGSTPNHGQVADLLAWRKVLFQLGLIGQDPNRYHGLGYGNVSQRISDTCRFWITGTKTGHVDELDSTHICEVLSCDAKKNNLSARGQIKPSSEALTHGAFYSEDSKLRYVFHVHCPEIWQLADKLSLPCTPLEAAYGTPAMAEAVSSLLKRENYLSQPVVIMKGHKDGLFSYGETAAQAGNVLVDLLAQVYALP